MQETVFADNRFFHVGTFDKPSQGFEILWPIFVYESPDRKTSHFVFMALNIICKVG